MPEGDVVWLTARSLNEALLDQRDLAGIGTWFAAEMLFLRGIDPGRA